MLVYLNNIRLLHACSGVAKIYSPKKNRIARGKSDFPKMHTNVFIVPNNKRLNKKRRVPTVFNRILRKKNPVI